LTPYAFPPLRPYGEQPQFEGLDKTSLILGEQLEEHIANWLHLASPVVFWLLVVVLNGRGLVHTKAPWGSWSHYSG